MARSVLTTALKKGDVVSSQRVRYRVWSFGENADHLRSFPMKGKAIVLQEATRVRLSCTRSRWNKETKAYENYPSHITRKMVLLSHFKHGIVMYLYTRDDDCKWMLTKKDNPDDQVSSGSAGGDRVSGRAPSEGSDPPS